MNLRFLKNTATIIGLFVIVLSSACKKSKDDNTTEPTRKELLSYSWKVTDVQMENGTSVISLPIPAVACLKDNILTLKNDDSFVFDEGAVVCDPPMNAAGKWSLSADGKVLTLTPATGDPVTINIVDVTKTTFKFNYTISEGVGQGTYVIILSHA